MLVTTALEKIKELLNVWLGFKESSTHYHHNYDHLGISWYLVERLNEFWCFLCFSPQKKMILLLKIVHKANMLIIFPDVFSLMGYL